MEVGWSGAFIPLSYRDFFSFCCSDLLVCRKSTIFMYSLLFGELAKKDYTLTICPEVLRVTEIKEIAVNPFLTMSKLGLAFIRKKAHVFISI